VLGADDLREAFRDAYIHNLLHVHLLLPDVTLANGLRSRINAVSEWGVSRRCAASAAAMDTRLGQSWNA
jgi:hypothetical protein